MLGLQVQESASSGGTWKVYHSYDDCIVCFSHSPLLISALLCLLGTSSVTPVCLGTMAHPLLPSSNYGQEDKDKTVGIVGTSRYRYHPPSSFLL